jgi:hypothetical protein
MPTSAPPLLRYWQADPTMMTGEQPVLSEAWRTKRQRRPAELHCSSHVRDGVGDEEWADFAVALLHQVLHAILEDLLHAKEA